MTILGVDTAAAHGGVCLLVPGEAPRLRDLQERGRHAELLLPATLALLEEAGKGWPDLDLVAVNVGPGSFTGIRIGVALALGVAAAQGVPAAGVGCLDILARACYDATSPPIGAYIVSAADVRRGEVVLARYRVTADGPTLDEAERLAAVADPGPAPPEGTVVAGDAAALIWPDALYRRWVPDGRARAEAVAQLGGDAARTGAVEAPVPRYARPADARPKRK